MKKLSLISMSFLIILMFFGVLTYLISFAEPAITIKAELTPITDSDYNRIKKRTEPFIATSQKNDFMRINMKIECSEPLFIIKNRNIQFEHLSTILDNEKNVYNLSGGSGGQDIPNESKAFYTESAEVYLNGVSADNLKDLFNREIVKISWDKIGKGKEDRIYHLNDFITVP